MKGVEVGVLALVLGGCERLSVSESGGGGGGGVHDTVSAHARVRMVCREWAQGHRAVLL